MYSRMVFEKCRLPDRLPISEEELDALCPADWPEEDTAVTPRQAGVLRYCAEYVKNNLESGIPLAEIGSYRGVTTCWLAEHSNRIIYAVDPFVGYGGFEKDLEIFQERIGGERLIKHIRATSGAARMEIGDIGIGLIFIDAVHNFSNTMFDALNWEDLIVPNGLIVFHDADEKDFAGTRRATFLMSRRHELFAHVDGLVVFRKK